MLTHHRSFRSVSLASLAILALAPLGCMDPGAASDPAYGESTQELRSTTAPSDLPADQPATQDAPTTPTAAPVPVRTAPTTALGLECAPDTGRRTGVDQDGDHLVDSCEQTLAELYAPVVIHSSAESNYPTNVDWFLARTSLWFYDDACSPVMNHAVLGGLTQSSLLGRGYTGGCGSSDTVYSAGTRSWNKQRTFYLADVDGASRQGSPDTRDWTTYVHVQPNRNWGVTIQYWRFYAYNDAANNHGGDWEGVQVVLDLNLRPSALRFMGHTTIDTLFVSETEWEGTHPRIYSEGGGHASRPHADGILSRCVLGGGCTVNLADPRTYTRQETWSSGLVRWYDGRVSSTGRLLNVGSKLAPLNGQDFVRYAGLWGSPGSFYWSSGYWGPAYNETAMHSDGYISAWCDGLLYASWAECTPASTSR